MVSPTVKQGDANAHRQQPSPETETDGGDTKIDVDAESPEEATDPDAVTVTTGGDPDDPDPDDPDRQTYSGDDSGGGGLRGFLTNKRVIALVVLAAVIGLYLASQRGGGQGNVNARGTDAPMTADSPEEIEEALDAANQPPDRNYQVPSDQDDPLVADGYLIGNTDIFPSLADDDERQPEGG